MYFYLCFNFVNLTNSEKISCLQLKNPFIATRAFNHQTQKAIQIEAFIKMLCLGKVQNNKARIEITSLCWLWSFLQSSKLLYNILKHIDGIMLLRFLRWELNKLNHKQYVYLINIFRTLSRITLRSADTINFLIVVYLSKIRSASLKEVTCLINAHNMYLWNGWV